MLGFAQQTHRPTLEVPRGPTQTWAHIEDYFAWFRPRSPRTALTSRGIKRRKELQRAAAGMFPGAGRKIEGN